MGTAVDFFVINISNFHCSNKHEFYEDILDHNNHYQISTRNIHIHQIQNKMLKQTALRTLRTITSKALITPIITRLPTTTTTLTINQPRQSYVTFTNTEETAVRPLVAYKAPNFSAETLFDTEIKQFDLEKSTKGKWKILVFYPLDFTFVCPTELIDFNDRLKEFHDVNTEVIGISVDSPFSHLAWRNTPRSNGGLGKFTMPLVSDITKAISTKYQVYLPEGGVSLRGLYIIAPDMKIKHQSVNELAVGRSVDETLRLLKAFQYVEKHGEVCPSGWQPGSATMKGDPEGSKSYFKKVKDN
jgi:peroxiredoxin (alkyl hydroperoxide reductase subunit C)